MAFKMRSGNKVSFKNMGGNSPGKQGLGQQKQIILPSGNRIEGLQIKKKGEQGKSISDYEKKFGKKWQQGTEGKYVDINTEDNADNKESKIDAGDTKSEWNFDWMQLLDNFLTSGGGKGGLLKAAGGALTKKSPNELLAMQKVREARKKRRKEKLLDAQNLETDIITGENEDKK